MFKSFVGKYGNLSIALGFFDGVHVAHCDVISNAVKIAKENKQKSAVITFEEHPSKHFGQSVEYISTIENRNNLIYSLGIDYIFNLKFDKLLAETSCEKYLEELVKTFAPIAITTGFNHTFGKSKCGTPSFLDENKAKYNYEYYQIEPHKIGDDIVSSSQIRKFLKNGNITNANIFLGRDFTIEGVVIKGQQLGRTIGFPTANILYPQELVKIPFGVYSVNVIINNNEYQGIMNFGVKPTIDSNNRMPLAETHICNFNQDIYGKKILIKIKKMIRPETRFNSLDELKTQIKKDLELC